MELEGETLLLMAERNPQYDMYTKRENEGVLKMLIQNIIWTTKLNLKRSLGSHNKSSMI